MNEVIEMLSIKGNGLFIQNYPICICSNNSTVSSLFVFDHLQLECLNRFFTFFSLRLWVSVSTFSKLYESLIPAFCFLSLSIAQACQKIAHPGDHIADNLNCYIFIRNSYAIEQKTIGRFYRYDNPFHFFKETLFRKLNKIVHQSGNHFFIPVTNCFHKVIKKHAVFLSKIVVHESRLICLENSFVRKISTFHKFLKQWKSCEVVIEHFENIPVLGNFSARGVSSCGTPSQDAVLGELNESS